MNSVRNLLTGTATKYMLLGVNIVVGIFLMPYTIRHLGTTEYGLWMVVASMTAYFQLLDLGYGNGLVRHVADADARGDVALVNRILSTFVIVYSAIGLAAALVVAGMVVWVVPNFPKLLPSQVALARFVLAMIGIRVAVGFPMTVFGTVTTARQRFALNNLVATAAALANGAVTFAVLAAGYRVRAVVAGSTAVALLSYIAYAWTAKKAFPELRLRFSGFSRHLVRDVTAFSLYVFMIDLAIQIGFNLDNVILGAAMGAAAVAVYTVAVRLADYQRQVSSQFNSLMFPVVVRYGAANDPEALRRMLIDGTRLALMLVCGVSVCLMGYAVPLVARWMGPGFDGAILPLYILALMGIVIVGQQPLGSILLGTGRHRLVAFTSLAEATVNLLLSLALVGRYGAVGVALGSLIPVTAANVLILGPAACRQLGVPIARFARSVLTGPIVGAIVAAIAGAMLRHSWPTQSIAGVLLQGATVGVIYLLAVWLFGFDHDVRERYSAYGRELFISLLRRRAATPAA